MLRLRGSAAFSGAHSSLSMTERVCVGWLTEDLHSGDEAAEAGGVMSSGHFLGLITPVLPFRTQPGCGA